MYIKNIWKKKMKYVLLLILLVCSSFASSKVIAEVGEFQITSAELQQEMGNPLLWKQQMVIGVSEVSSTNGQRKGNLPPKIGNCGEGH